MSAQGDRLWAEWKAWSCGHDEPRDGAPWCVDCVLSMVRRIRQLERDLRWSTTVAFRYSIHAHRPEIKRRVNRIRKAVAR